MAVTLGETRDEEQETSRAIIKLKVRTENIFLILSTSPSYVLNFKYMGG